MYFWGRVLGLEAANSFTTLAGGNPAALATQVRFYQQQGFDTTTAVTSSALVSLSSLLIKLVLFLIALPIAWSSFHFGHSLHKGSHAKVLYGLLVIILGLTAAGISKNQATAAVFVERTFTAYLPPIVGWFTFMWMRRREYL